MVGERRLVPVVAVGDQKPAVGERLTERVVGQTPEARALDLQLGRAVGPLERRSALVEQEDRLELGAHLAQEPEPPLLRAAMRALVRQDDARSRRARPAASRRGPVRRARDAVRADVVLRERPEAGLFSGTSAPSSRQSRKLRPASSSESGSVRWTTLCGLLREQRVALLGPDHVVGRRDEVLERTGAVGVVAKRAKRLDLGHAADRSIRLRA